MEDVDVERADVAPANATRSVVAGALAVGVVLGFGGNFVAPGDVQNLMYALSAMGLILGSALLAVDLAATRYRIAAAGFILLALGESRVLNPTDVPGGEASFAAGTLLYLPALVLIAWSEWPPVWARVTGAVAAVFFGAHAVAFFAGLAVDPAGPLSAIGYTALSVTILGWIAKILRRRNSGSSRASVSGV